MAAAAPTLAGAALSTAAASLSPKAGGEMALAWLSAASACVSSGLAI